MNSSIMNILPASGQEIVRQDYAGNTIIRSRIATASSRRLGYEKVLPRGVKVGLQGWERAHSQGQGTGHESAHAITYAPKEVNQGLQRLGVESAIVKLQEAITEQRFREKFVRPGDNIVLVLTTVTATHKKLERGRQINTNRLKEISYVVQSYSEQQRRFHTLFEASISVDDKDKNPGVQVEVDEMLSMKLIQRPNFLYGN
jgi:hypothetical protein